MTHLNSMQKYSNMIRASFLCVLCAFVVPSLHGEDHARARELYSQICINCHGPKLDGGKGPALVDAYWRHGSEPEAILRAINKGFPGTEMVAFEEALPESDRLALRDYLVAQQEGLREVVRQVYPREPFQGKRLTPALFDAVEASSQKRLPENVYYFERNQDGVLRGVSKLIVRQPGKYHFNIRPRGRTAILVDGREVHYSDEKDKRAAVNETFALTPGVHRLEILHEERSAPSLRFGGTLQHESGKRWELAGRSLQGSPPKIIVAEPEAKVVRKWIDGLPPRTLLCLLSNQVMVAYNPQTAEVLKAWRSASIDQTPSLPDRSTKPSEIRGEPIPDAAANALRAEQLRFLRYEVELETVHLVSLADGKEKTVTITPEGTQSFKLSVK
jgi:cytochrome c553